MKRKRGTSEIENPVLAQNGDEASARLIDLAKQSGAPDNVTVVLTYC